MPTYTRVPIDVNEFTRNVASNPPNPQDYIVTGEGIFDVIMMTCTEHLRVQLEAGRIRGEDYANAYITMMQAVLQICTQIWLQKESEDAKKLLYYRQIEGFDEDFKQKLLKISMDSYAVGMSVARDQFLGDLPMPMTKFEIDKLYQSFIYPELDMYPYGREEELLNRGPIYSPPMHPTPPMPRT